MVVPWRSKMGRSVTVPEDAAFTIFIRPGLFKEEWQEWLDKLVNLLMERYPAIWHKDNWVEHIIAANSRGYFMVCEYDPVLLRGGNRVRGLVSLSFVPWSFRKKVAKTWADLIESDLRTALRDSGLGTLYRKLSTSVNGESVYGIDFEAYYG